MLIEEIPKFVSEYQQEVCAKKELHRKRKTYRNDANIFIERIMENTAEWSGEIKEYIGVIRTPYVSVQDGVLSLSVWRWPHLSGGPLSELRIRLNERDDSGNQHEAGFAVFEHGTLTIGYSSDPENQSLADLTETDESTLQLLYLMNSQLEQWLQKS